MRKQLKRFFIIAYGILLIILIVSFFIPVTVGVKHYAADESINISISYSYDARLSSFWIDKIKNYVENLGLFDKRYIKLISPMPKTIYIQKIGWEEK